MTKEQWKEELEKFITDEVDLPIEDFAFLFPFIEHKIHLAEARGAKLSEEIKEKAWKYDQLCK